MSAIATEWLLCAWRVVASPTDHEAEQSRGGGAATGERTAPTSELASASSTERECIAQVRAGNVQAFEAIYREEWVNLVSFARTLVRDDDVAAEIVSDVFSGVWHRRDGWRPASIRGYLFGAVRNRALNHRRSLARADAAMARLAPDEVAGVGEPFVAPDVRVEAAEQLRAVARALVELTEPQRTLLMLRWQRQMRWDEIAQVLGVSVTAVQQQHSRLLKSLRATVEALLG